RHTRSDRDWSSDVCSSDLQSALVAKKVGEVDLGFYATPEYLARHGCPQGLEDLEQHALVGFDSPARAVRDLPGFNMPIDRELFRSEERRVGKEGRMRGEAE